MTYHRRCFIFITLGQRPKVKPHIATAYKAVLNYFKKKVLHFVIMLSCLSGRCWFVFVIPQVADLAVMNILTFQVQNCIGLFPD